MLLPLSLLLLPGRENGGRARGSGLAARTRLLQQLLLLLKVG